MSIDSDAGPQGSDSTAASCNAPCTSTATPDPDSAASNASESADRAQQTQSGSGSLLTSLLSPFSSILHILPENKPGEVSTSEKKDAAQSQDSSIPQTNPSDTPKDPEPESTPEPYYTPKTTPTFKRLAKLRLSGTREKQLIRAAARAHNDPPPPPGLGVCCGSSCDPCVNELWRQERDTWRERWGDHAVEDKKDSELEW
ncbi:uncharacterized protein N7498_002926 [Penicillium cinerascens]|uniref:Oxidoreductase-like domain-containing protein n=1 Tax=Penicillium cinerascens TaxID=70096 RepID=A0A9W9NCR1_9EURO|nr:uncharacterized protein N7498_002926 [Penicillium cinerascens]KAJ5216519.1 hypothetical protein N7498_002926 [Penicillium cinerascens]